MTEQDEAIELDVSAAASIPSGGFAVVEMILELVTDPAKCRERVRTLHALGGALDKQRHALAVERAEHDAFVAKERSSLAAERDVLRNAQVKLHADQGTLAHCEQVYREQKAELDRLRGRFQTVGPGGLVQEFAPGYVRDEDEDVQTRQVHRDDHFAAGTTLTREPELIPVRRPRGRPRRSAEI
jgi:hypothetical protein